MPSRPPRCFSARWPKPHLASLALTPFLLVASPAFTPDFLEQKLSYIHSNPVQLHWQLADTPETYP